MIDWYRSLNKAQRSCIQVLSFFLIACLLVGGYAVHQNQTGKWRIESIELALREEGEPLTWKEMGYRDLPPDDRGALLTNLMAEWYARRKSLDVSSFVRTFEREDNGDMTFYLGSEDGPIAHDALRSPIKWEELERRLQPLQPVFDEMVTTARKGPWNPGVDITGLGNLYDSGTQDPLYRMSELAGVFGLIAILEFRRGNRDRSIDAMKGVYQVAQAIAHSPPITAHYYQIGVEWRADVLMQELIREPGWNDAQLARLQDLLPERDLDAYLLKLVRSERIFLHQIRGTDSYLENGLGIIPPAKRSADEFEETVNVLLFAQLWDTYFTIWHPHDHANVLELQGEVIGIVQEELSPRAKLRKVSEARMAHDERSQPWHFISRNGFFASDDEAERLWFARVTKELLRLEIALRRYELKHGILPEQLTALVPEYVSSIPIDPMSGLPYRYKVFNDGKVEIYSVGPDGHDDGGDRDRYSSWRTKDWLLNYPFRLPR